MLENNQKKKCNKCKCEKNLNDFYFRNDTKKYISICIECEITTRNEYKICNIKKGDYIQKLPFEMKICTKCHCEKNISEFRFRIDLQKHYSSCKQCEKLYITNKRNLNKIKGEYKGDNNIFKLCKICNKEKNINEFYFSIKDQVHECRCKECETYRHKKHHIDNRKHRLEYIKKWSKTPFGASSRKNSKYKRRFKEKTGSVTSNQILELEQKASKCYWCGSNLKGKKHHIDHYIPLVKEGEHVLSNLVVSCSKCNLTKGSKDPIKFANSIGRLL